jgi:excisionase family DNA binding protein
MNSFITTKEAAKKLNISVRRVQALIAAGRLPAEKIGNIFAIRPSDLKLANGRMVARLTALNRKRKTGTRLFESMQVQ